MRYNFVIKINRSIWKVFIQLVFITWKYKYLQQDLLYTG